MPEPAAMRVLSVNVSLARSVPYKGGTVSTGIGKEATRGRVRVGRLGLAGDEQADLRVHGGTAKAVYAYPGEHYAFWTRELPGMDLPWEFFGENLTPVGLEEHEVHVGDRFRMGTAVLEVTKPGFPCYELALRVGREDIIDRFLRSGRSGFDSCVIEEGGVAAGDPIERLRTEPGSPTIAEVVRARTPEEDDE